MRGRALLAMATVLGGLVLGAPVPQASAIGSSDHACEWGMYGQNPSRTFSTPDACASPINRLSAPTLTPKWVVKTPKTVTASPAVVGDEVYVGDWGGTLYALDADDGTQLWTYQVDLSPGAAFGPIVSSAAVADASLGGSDGLTRLVIFGAGPYLYAIDATGSDAGTLQWRAAADQRDPMPADTVVQVESSPVVVDGVVYVGMDNHNHAGTGQLGGLLAIDLATGSRIRKFEPERPTGTEPMSQDRGCGGMWSSPVIDTATRTAYFGTANCPGEDPALFDWNDHIEAVTALDLDTFAVEWTFQPHDPFNEEDHDFGATPNLFVDNAGRKVVGAGNKNGHYYVLDATSGALYADIEVSDDGYISDGFAIGGFLGSPAAYHGRVFGGTGIPFLQDRDGDVPLEHTKEGAYAAIDPSGADVDWRGTQAPAYAATAVVNGVALHGALDNLLRAYDTETGIVLWAAPLLGPISSGPAVVGDSVYVGSGTSSSDLCGKDTPVFSDVCFLAFDGVLGGTGGIHAFELATAKLPTVVWP